MAEEAVLSEGGHAHHLSCHSKSEMNTHTHINSVTPTAPPPHCPTTTTTSKGWKMKAAGKLALGVFPLNLEAAKWSEIDIDGLSWQQ